MKAFFALLGKLCISSIFIFTAIQDLLQWNSREQRVYELLSSSLHSLKGGGLMMNIVGYCLHNIGVVFAVALFLKLLGGISVLFSWKEKLGATLLLIYLIPTTFLFHDFWNMLADTKLQEMHIFGLNMAVAGGLFLLLSSDRKAAAPVESKSSKS